jgi:shikimate dehydrogenase
MKAISGNARLAGVMGWPVGHSLSPRLHGYWLETLQIDGAYVPLVVAPNNAVDAIAAMSKLGFRGFNVTVPHKEAAMGCVDAVDDLARRIGAVNTIVYDDEGRSHGTNTDGFGFIENIRQQASGYDFSKGPAVVLGAGGAARAVIVALMDAGASEIRVINRTRARAEALAAQVGHDGNVGVVSWEQREGALADVALLVNTTTLGMIGQAALDMNLNRLPESACVTDIVYAPLETPLLAEARKRGNSVVDGIGMLLHQARPGFKAWFGTDPKVSEALRTHMLAGL